MALANKELHNSRSMAIIQASAFYEHDFGPKLDMYGVYQQPESPPKNSSSVSSPSSSNSNGGGGLIYNLSSEEGHSVINFKPEYGNFGSSSCLTFDQTKRALVYPKLMLGGDDPAAAAAVWDVPWLNDQEIVDTEDGELHDTTKNKRPSTGENEQSVKKQCVAAAASSKKTKPKPESTSKDPQSVAAKNRRERISERLKILQELVPNGSKVDLVTMLEKAIGYVKFLQLQVKVLATDEFWPAQGGKAPDLCQVREAIDAILASQRDRNS